MNTITIYTETEDILKKIALISELEKINNIEQLELIKYSYKQFKVYLTNKHNNRVAFNLSFDKLSLLVIFSGGNLLID